MLGTLPVSHVAVQIRPTRMTIQGHLETLSRESHIYNPKSVSTWEAVVVNYLRTGSLPTSSLTPKPYKLFVHALSSGPMRVDVIRRSTLS